MNVEDCKKKPLPEQVMKNGKRLVKKRSLKEISGFRAERMEHLPAEYKRFQNPHICKVGISDE